MQKLLFCSIWVVPLLLIFFRIGKMRMTLVARVLIVRNWVLAPAYPPKLALVDCNPFSRLLSYLVTGLEWGFLTASVMSVFQVYIICSVWKHNFLCPFHFYYAKYCMCVCRECASATDKRRNLIIMP